MKYTPTQIEEIFISNKTYSDNSNAYVELGLKRIYNFYETINGNICLCDITECSLTMFKTIIEQHYEKFGIIPKEAIFNNNTYIEETLQYFDIVYMDFLYLIEKDAKTSSHKKELITYLDFSDRIAIERIKKYYIDVI